MTKRKKRPRREPDDATPAGPDDLRANGTDDSGTDDSDDGDDGGDYGGDDEYYDDPTLIPGTRFGAGSGVVFALLSFVGSSFLGVGDVKVTDSSADVAAKFVDARGRITLGVLMTLLSLFFLLVFAAYLHRWLRIVEGDRGWLATLALGGGLLAVGGLLVALLVPFAGTVLDDYGGDPVIARTLFVLGRQAVVIALVPLAAFVGAASLVAARAEELPRWLTSSGLVLAAGLLVVPIAFIPYLFSTLWIGVVAVTLLTRARPAGGWRRAS